MDYESIYYENETKYKEINNQKLKKFIDAFVESTKIDIESVKAIEMVKENDYEDLAHSLRNYIFTFYPQYISLYYHLLQESHYKMVYDILDGMFLLGCSTNKRLNREKCNLLLQSFYVNTISYVDGKIILNSHFGEYSFSSLRDYFRGNYDATTYIRNNDMPGHCHNVSWDFISILNRASLVTELIPYYFEGTYYHSIIRNEDGLFIDLANEIVYGEDVRKNLFQGQIVCETKKEDLEKDLYNAIVASNHPSIEEDFYESLILALHKQMKIER